MIPYIWYQSRARRLIRGRGRGRRKKKKKKKRGGEGSVGLRPYLDLLVPSAADPRVMDLWAAWVEPDHRWSACGRALDLVGAPLVDLRRTSTEPPLVGRSATEATRRWRVHPTVSAHTGEGLGRRLGCALSDAARRSLGVAAATRERERRKREMRLGFAQRSRSAVLFSRKPRAAVGLRWTAHTHRTETQPRRDETFLAQTQVAAWSVGRGERERAAGLISVSGRMAAWHGERGLRKSGSRAVFGFGPLHCLARG
jgi:hypothetical protein